jgi:hypothetical protein
MALHARAVKRREITQNLELSASSIMTSFTHYRALLAPLAVGALTADELSTGYSQLAGVLDALLGHDLPGHPLDRFWFTNLRDQCLRYALSLREPQPAAYLHARKHHLRGLKQTLRHQFVRLHGGWKLGTLLKDVQSSSGTTISRLRGTCAAGGLRGLPGQSRATVTMSMLRSGVFQRCRSFWTSTGST